LSSRGLLAPIAALFAGLAAAGCGTRKAEKASASPPGAAGAPDVFQDVAQRPREAPRNSPRVVWLGLDGIDWDFMDRLSAEGKVPNWSRLVAEGSAGGLESFMPILSPIVWTTIATGFGPEVHRVLDFQEVDPKTGAKVPVSGYSRAVPAVWNLASAAGKRVGVVGWWATHPAEKVNGFFVSDRASPILYTAAPGAGVAYPPALEQGVGRILARDGRVRAEDLAPMLDMPAAEISASLSSGEGMENPVVALSRILASTRVTQRIARDLYDADPPDLTAVYFEGTDEIGHVFAPFTPPRLSCVSDRDFARYHRAAEAYFGLIDRILGQWMRRAREDGATLIVNSDHGFKWGEERTCERSSLEWSTAAFWHRMQGVFLAWGARVSPRRDRGKASVFDLAPTVLSLLDLPVEPGMTGRPVSSAFASLPVRRRRSSSPALRVERVAAREASPGEAGEFAKKLKALGYLSGSETQPLAPPGGDRPGMTEGAYNNLGLYERETSHRPAAAEKDFLKALELRPAYHSPMFNLAVLYRSEGRDAQAIDWLFRALAAGHADPLGTVLRWAGEFRAEGKPARGEEVLERASRVYPESENLARALADFRFRRHDCPSAYRAVERFVATTRTPETLNELGLLETCLGHRREAIALFHRSLSLRPGQPGVEESLGVLQRTPGK
jgi:predicted AlkP superfamily phosphohydrolase/phosphomutase